MFLLVLLLHHNVPVDVTDPQGHTCLMWAAYKGYPAVVDLFLRWGANVYATDEAGFTALHWALVKGSHGCIQKLIEYGSDRFAVTSTGKSPAVIADDMNSLRVWHRCLEECGYSEDGNPRSFGLASFLRGRGPITKFFFFWPFLVIWSVLMILSHMVVYAAVPLAAFIGYGLIWVAQQALQLAPADMKHMHHTVSIAAYYLNFFVLTHEKPFTAGVFAGLCFWVGVRWFITVLPGQYAQSLADEQAD